MDFLNSLLNPTPTPTQYVFSCVEEGKPHMEDVYFRPTFSDSNIPEPESVDWQSILANYIEEKKAIMTFQNYMVSCLKQFKSKKDFTKGSVKKILHCTKLLKEMLGLKQTLRENFLSKFKLSINHFPEDIRAEFQISFEEETRLSKQEEGFILFLENTIEKYELILAEMENAEVKFVNKNEAIANITRHYLEKIGVSIQ